MAAARRSHVGHRSETGASGILGPCCVLPASTALAWRTCCGCGQTAARWWRSGSGRACARSTTTTSLTGMGRGGLADARSIYTNVVLTTTAKCSLDVCLSVCPSICLSVCLSVCPSICLSIRPSVCLSVCLSVAICTMARTASCSPGGCVRPPALCQA
jgi:hypothetical protein